MKKLYLIFVALSLSSCNILYDVLLLPPTPKDLSKWQEEKFYEGKSTGIDKLINTDGYWLCEDSTYLCEYTDALLFYDDGTLGTFMFRRGKGDTGVLDFPRGMPGVDLKSAFEGSARCTFWCCYDCRNDTICAESYNIHPYWWDMVKLRFKVINKDTIELVSRRIYSNNEIGEWMSKNVRFTFVPTISLPDADNAYIKTKKWIWRDEKEWKAYKQRIQ